MWLGLNDAARLQPDSGNVSLGGFVTDRQAGASLTARARVNRALHLYATGELAYDRLAEKLGYGAYLGAGVRW